MDVIVDKLGANPAEIAVGYAAAEQEHARQQDALAEHGRSGVGDAAPAAASMGAVGGSIGPLGDRSMRMTGRMMTVADSDRGATALPARTRRRLFWEI